MSDLADLAKLYNYGKTRMKSSSKSRTNIKKSPKSVLVAKKAKINSCQEEFSQFD